MLAQVAGGLNANSARKWLQGKGYPNTEVSVALCDKAGININWLLQGTLPKFINRKTDTKALVLDEALHTLPADDAQQVLDFLGYKIGKVDGLIAGERLSRYMKMIDAFKTDMAKKRLPPN